MSQFSRGKKGNWHPSARGSAARARLARPGRRLYYQRVAELLGLGRVGQLVGCGGVWGGGGFSGGALWFRVGEGSVLEV